MKLGFKSVKITAMALRAKIKDVEFGVGDVVRVIQRIKEGEKTREAYFEGMVLSIRGRDPSKSFTVRKIAEGGVGVERIFPFNLPSMEKIVLVKEGTRGVRRSKLYYTRTKPPTEVEMIHKRAAVRRAFKEQKRTVKIAKSASAKKK